MLTKFKSFLADDAIFTALLLILVGVISFGLGRQSVSGATVSGGVEQKAGVIFTDVMPRIDQNTVETSQNPTVSNVSDTKNTINQPSVVPPQSSNSNTAQVAETPLKSTTKLVASRSGTKYHLLTCSGAKTIKEENKIYFDSIAQAQAAGYSPAANCPGLKE